jgi:hypothetical protein
LYHLAATQGDAKAQQTLLQLYDIGQGVPTGNVQAYKWLSLAGVKGVSGAASARERVERRMTSAEIVDAQTDLGLMYANGDGVPQDYAEAIRWYRPAAYGGGAEAQSSLGSMYANGRGLPQDDAEAVRWYKLAAYQGLASAQANLGVMYSRGRGVPQSDVEAYKWWSLAAAQGSDDAANNRDIVSSKMTPAQIAEAQRLTAEWKPDHGTANAGPSASSNRPAFANQIASTGTGFLITADGRMLTNAHVVRGCGGLSLADGSSVTVVDVDLGSDLALLDARSTSSLLL